MPRYLIEVSHQNSKEECMRTVSAFKKTGSHFLTNADWGCKDNDHRALIVVDVDSKEDALNIVPPSFRGNANVVELNKLALHNIEKDMSKHED